MILRTRRGVASVALGLLSGFLPWGGFGEEPISRPASYFTRSPDSGAHGGEPNSYPRTRSLLVRHPGEIIDVTVMSLTFAAIDANGRIVRDLRMEELEVFEDGSPVMLLKVDQRVHSVESATRQRSPGGLNGGKLRGWQEPVAVFVSAGLGSRNLLSNLSRQVSDEAARLTALGPVDVVVASPTPKVLTAAEQRVEGVRHALDLAVLEAASVTEVARNRRLFARALRQGMSIAPSHEVARSSPAVTVVRTREAMRRERALLRAEIERVVDWLQGQPPTAGGLLLWITGGFDLNPADFYVPLVEQINPDAGRTLRSDYYSQSLEHEVRWLIDVAVSLGWTVFPVTSSQTRFLFAANVDASDTSNRSPGMGAVRLAGQAADFSQVNPNRPLHLVAQATGGFVATYPTTLRHAIGYAASFYRLAYQVDRPLDGEMHQIEIHSLRPGVRIVCGRHAASGTSRGLAVGRGLCILAGKEDRGTLDLSTGILNIAKAEKGRRIGDLRVSVDLGELRDVLSPLGLGKMRVTVVVEIDEGSPFIEHQEIDLRWDQMEDIWRFSAGLKWPKKARRMAVVVEELVSSIWGASVVPLR